MQRRADGARVELVDIGGELLSPGLSADGSDLATRVFGRLPTWLLEVHGHRTTVADHCKLVRPAVTTEPRGSSPPIDQMWGSVLLEVWTNAIRPPSGDQTGSKA